MAFLRFVGLVNAAAWFGAALFFTIAAGPAFFSADMLAVFSQNPDAPFTKYYAGKAAMVVLKRYFLWLEICGLIAVLQGLAEAAYQGLPWKQTRNLLALGLLALSLAGGWGIQPKLQQLHAIKYHPATKPALREAASRSFAAWHAVSQGANLVLTAGLLVFFWKTAAARQRDAHTANPFQFRV